MDNIILESLIGSDQLQIHMIRAMRCRNTYTAQHANRKSVESNDENLNVNNV